MCTLTSGVFVGSSNPFISWLNHFFWLAEWASDHVTYLWLIWVKNINLANYKLNFKLTSPSSPLNRHRSFIIFASNQPRSAVSASWKTHMKVKTDHQREENERTKKKRKIFVVWLQGGMQFFFFCSFSSAAKGNSWRALLKSVFWNFFFRV